MSVRLMSTVWDRAPVKGAELIILLAAADYANDDGYLWPAPVKLAEKARVARETVWRMLSRCERAGVLERVDLSGGRAQGWRLHLEHLDRLARVTDDHVTADHADLGVTTDHAERDDRSPGSVTTDHREPSVEPSGNHSAPTERRGDRADDADGALPGMPAPPKDEAAEVVRDVVGTYVSAYQDHRGHRPPGDVVAQVGREAKRLVADGAIPVDKLYVAATSAGRQGWRSIETEANRLGAPPDSRRRPSNVWHSTQGEEVVPPW